MLKDGSNCLPVFQQRKHSFSTELSYITCNNYSITHDCVKNQDLYLLWVKVMLMGIDECMLRTNFALYRFMYNIFYDRIIIARTAIICFFVSCWLLKSNTKRGTVTAPRSPRIYSNRIEVLKL